MCCGKLWIRFARVRRLKLALRILMAFLPCCACIYRLRCERQVVCHVNACPQGDRVSVENLMKRLNPSESNIPEWTKTCFLPQLQSVAYGVSLVEFLDAPQPTVRVVSHMVF